MSIDAVNLSGMSTCELVEELRKREGVEVKIAEPYEDIVISINGSAIVLTIIDQPIRLQRYEFLMQRENCTYEEAHEYANKKYDWQKVCGETVDTDEL